MVPQVRVIFRGKVDLENLPNLTEAATGTIDSVSENQKMGDGEQLRSIAGGRGKKVFRASGRKRIS